VFPQHSGALTAGEQPSRHAAEPDVGRRPALLLGSRRRPRIDAKATNYERAFELRPAVYKAWQQLNGAIKAL